MRAASQLYILCSPAWVRARLGLLREMDHPIRDAAQVAGLECLRCTGTVRGRDRRSARRGRCKDGQEVLPACHTASVSPRAVHATVDCGTCCLRADMPCLGLVTMLSQACAAVAPVGCPADFQAPFWACCSWARAPRRAGPLATVLKGGEGNVETWLALSGNTSRAWCAADTATACRPPGTPCSSTGSGAAALQATTCHRAMRLKLTSLVNKGNETIRRAWAT